MFTQCLGAAVGPQPLITASSKTSKMVAQRAVGPAHELLQPARTPPAGRAQAEAVEARVEKVSTDHGSFLLKTACSSTL